MYRHLAQWGRIAIRLALTLSIVLVILVWRWTTIDKVRVVSPDGVKPAAYPGDLARGRVSLAPELAHETEEVTRLHVRGQGGRVCIVYEDP